MTGKILMTFQLESKKKSRIYGLEHIAQSRQINVQLELESQRRFHLFYGSTSWFKYEELIDDWLDLTVLEAEKRGPALQNRLVGDAEMYTGLFDRKSLRDADGVKYSRDTLRPHFIKGVQSVFLSIFYQVTRARRGNVEMVKWIENFHCS